MCAPSCSGAGLTFCQRPPLSQALMAELVRAVSATSLHGVVGNSASLIDILSFGRL